MSKHGGSAYQFEMETSAQGWHSPDMETGHMQMGANQRAAGAKSPGPPSSRKKTKSISFEGNDDSGPKIVASGLSPEAYKAHLDEHKEGGGATGTAHLK